MEKERPIKTSRRPLQFGAGEQTDYYFNVDGDRVEIGHTFTDHNGTSSNLLPEGRYEIQWHYHHAPPASAAGEVTGWLVEEGRGRDETMVGSNIRVGLSGTLVYRDAIPVKFVFD